VSALADALTTLREIAEGQTSSPDERANLRRKAKYAVNKGATILQDELEATQREKPT